MEFNIPYPLKAEHEGLHNMLRRATNEPGEVGDAAKSVAKLIHPHFIKEEGYGFPPISWARITVEFVLPFLAGVVGLAFLIRATP